jgi:hypothetical protein
MKSFYVSRRSVWIGVLIICGVWISTLAYLASIIWGNYV